MTFNTQQDRFCCESRYSQSRQIFAIYLPNGKNSDDLGVNVLYQLHFVGGICEISRMQSTYFETDVLFGPADHYDHMPGMEFILLNVNGIFCFFIV